MKSEAEINRILQSMNLYQICNVSKNCTHEELKKCYHAIAREIHPDRNPSERATEAFQKLSNAYKILKDDESRRRYDLTGEVDENRPRPRQYHQEYVEPDIFSFLFGVPPGFTRAQRRPRQQEPEPLSGMQVIMKLLPIIIPVVMLLLPGGKISGLFDFRSIFKPISRKSVKSVLRFEDIKGVQCFTRKSPKYGAQYYVPLWWLQNLNNGMSMRDVEDKLDVIADELYIEDLKIKCELEKNQINKEGQRCAYMKKTINGN